MIRYVPALVLAVASGAMFLGSLGGDPGAAMPRSILLIPCVIFAACAALLWLMAWAL